MNSDTPSKVEFAIQIKGPACVESVKSKLKESGIRSEQIADTVVDSQNKELRLVIETSEPWIKLQETIESTGRRSVLVGFSDQSAVVMLDKGNIDVKGVIRFCSITANKPGIVIDGVIDGLQPNIEHSLSIREYGDVSQGLLSLGEIYMNSNYKITPDESGRSTIRTVDNKLYVSELIGRSVVVTPNTGTNFVCGIISRAAGIFQNWKRICACDGISIWDERDRPLAGTGRRID